MTAVGNRLQTTYFLFTLEHFETHPYLVETVMNRLQLGGLVHHVFWRRDLAAVM